MGLRNVLSVILRVLTGLALGLAIGLQGFELSKAIPYFKVTPTTDPVLLLAQADIPRGKMGVVLFFMTKILTGKHNFRCLFVWWADYYYLETTSQDYCCS